MASDTHQPDVDPQAVAATLDAVRAALSEERPYTLGEVARAVHLDPDDLARLFTAANRHADDDRYGSRDMEYAREP